MKHQDVVKKTLELLSEETEWVNRYTGYIKKLNPKDNHKKKFRTPTGLSVYSSVSRHIGDTYDLRFEGQSVGELSQSDKVILHPKGENNNKYFGGSQLNEKVDWQSEKAKKFRAFFRNQVEGCNLKSPEHRVENRLLEEFAKKTKAEGKALVGIQPIKLNGCYFQMPTPLKASNHVPMYAEHRGGGIDILARIKRTRICVMEVKDENKNKESQSRTMEQALIYATFIAKLLRSESGQDWWDFFMDHREKSIPLPEKLEIEVVTIMPFGNTEEFAEETIEVPELATTLNCHSLYFDNEEYAKGKFVFSGTFPKVLMK